MDLNNQRNKISEEEEDRISGLPDSILHYILSFLETKSYGTKCVVRTFILSKRWMHIWRCIPSLVFPHLSSSDDMGKFMDFMDRTLLVRDPASSIQKFSLSTNDRMDVSRVHSWISIIVGRNVEKLTLGLHLDKPFSVPVSLFTCESLTELELSASSTVHFPKTLSLPKLLKLTLWGIQFTDNDCWNELHCCNCPVLEKLTLERCTWFGVRKFCISIPTLKFLVIDGDCNKADGLQDCDLKIYAPSLVSITYGDYLAKDYDLSGFQKLEYADIYLDEAARSEQWISSGAAVTKFIRAVSHVKRLTISGLRLQDLLDADDVVDDLPAFHNLNQLVLILGPAGENIVFALLKAAPNLKCLVFDEGCCNDYDDDEDDDDDETEELFRNLQSVKFEGFTGEAREWRWAKLILKNAKSLMIMTIASYYGRSKQEVLRSKLSNLPRASGRCVFEFV